MGSNVKSKPYGISKVLLRPLAPAEDIVFEDIEETFNKANWFLDMAILAENIVKMKEALCGIRVSIFSTKKVLLSPDMYQEPKVVFVPEIRITAQMTVHNRNLTFEMYIRMYPERSQHFVPYGISVVSQGPLDSVEREQQFGGHQGVKAHNLLNDFLIAR